MKNTSIRYNEQGLTVLDLYGSWYTMGQQYGMLAKQHLLHVLDYMDSQLANDPERQQAAQKIADDLYAHYPSYIKTFFEGMEETSGLSDDRLRLCNAVEYAEPSFQCSGMAVWADYSVDGRLIYGRNYDAAHYAEIASDIVLTVYHPEDGLAVATLGYAGEIYCVNGWNERGLFLELNNGMPSAGDTIHWELCPGTSQLLDVLTRACSMDDMDRFFCQTQSSTSFIIGVADRHEARSYEWCYQGVKRADTQTPGGLMLMTNHYVHPDWPFAEPDDAHSWLSQSRRSNLMARAQEHKGRIDVERMQQIMQTMIADGGPMHEYTRYQLMYTPDDMCLRVHIPGWLDWTTIDLRKYLIP